MATIIKTPDPILSVLAFTRVLNFSKSLEGQTLRNKAQKIRLQHLGQSLQSEQEIRESEVGLFRSRAALAELERTFLKDTLPARTLDLQSGVAKGIGGDLGRKFGRPRAGEEGSEFAGPPARDVPDAADLSRIVEGLGPNLKQGTLNHALILDSMIQEREQAIKRIDEDTLTTATKTIVTGQRLGQTAEGLALAERLLDPDSAILRIARDTFEELQRQPSRLQGLQDSREAAEADSLLKEMDLDRSEQVDIDIVNDKNASKTAKENAQGRLDKRTILNDTLKRLNVSRGGKAPGTVSSDLQKAITGQPKKDAQKRSRVRVKKALESPHATKLLQGARKVSDLSAQVVAGLFGIVIADEGITMTRAEFEKLLQTRLDNLNEPTDFPGLGSSILGGATSGLPGARVGRGR